MDPGLARRLTRTIITASLLTSFIPFSSALAAPKVAGMGTDGMLRVTSQRVYVDGAGQRWIDGIVENIGQVALKDSRVPISFSTGDAQSDTIYAEIDAYTVAAGGKATFHTKLPAELADVEPYAYYGGGWAAQREPIALEIVNVTPANASDYTVQRVATQGSCDHVCHEEPQGPAFEPRVYSVVVRNPASVPVSGVRIGGLELQGAASDDAALLDTLSGSGDEKVIAPGETATLEIRGEAAEDDDPVTGITAHVSAQALEAPSISLTFSTTAPTYGKTVGYTIRLADSAGQPLLGERTVKLYWSTDGEKWQYSYLTTTTGVVTGTVKPLQRVYYKAVFWGADDYSAAFSGETMVQPATEVTTPKIVPTSIARGKSFSAKGLILPDHAAGSRAVKVLCYHRENSVWVLRKTVYATTGAYPGARASYAATLSLPKAGRWAIKGYHPSDSRTRADSSGYDYITVR